MKPKIRVYSNDRKLGSTQGKTIRVVTDTHVIHINDKGDIKKVTK